MKPRIRVLTLAVGDLERSLAFYRDGLGLPTDGIVGREFEDGAVAFFRMDGGLTLALYPAASLAKDAGIAATEVRLGAVSVGHLVGIQRGGRRRRAAGGAGGRRGHGPAARALLGRVLGLLPRP